MAELFAGGHLRFIKGKTMAKICDNCACYKVCVYANPNRTIDCTLWKPCLEWIPVSERLPEVGTGNVLVARSYKGKPYVDLGEFINGTACCWGDEYAIDPREHITTHWMPLPEPPKEV